MEVEGVSQAKQIVFFIRALSSVISFSVMVFTPSLLLDNIHYYGACWDQSWELEIFVDHEDWEEIAKFLTSLAEDKCKKWYSANKGEATND